MTYRLLSNKWYNVDMKRCLCCQVELVKKHQKKFCSNKCQVNFQYRFYIKNWKEGKVSGNRGIITKNISAHIRKYLINKFGEHCSLCGWNRRHSRGYVPLEIDHVDGNSENNLETNLRLVCPNCHALTPNFKNLNKGRGRKWRINKYVKNLSP